MSKLTAYDKFLQQALKYGFSLFGLPKTGQVTSYTDYDDGYYEKGYPKTGVRFTDNGDGTITDNATGLMWASDGNGAGCNNGDFINMANAITWAESLTFAGYSDWRLPNIKELVSILDYEENNPAINATFFPNTTNGNYESTTTVNSNTSLCFVVKLADGIVVTVPKGFSHSVRAVRGGV